MVVKMLVYDDREDVFYCFCVEWVNGDDVKMF